jgi:alcohol dehydrogenase (cytochrome c)
VRIATVGLAFGLVCGAQEPVKYEDILKGPGSDWVTYAGSYSGQRHSPLKQITPANAGSMTNKWVYHVERANRLQCVPLVRNGIMYVTNSNEVIALDAATGRQIWNYYDSSVKRSDVNRGVALLNDKVYFVTSDAHLVALKASNGAVIWDSPYADTKLGYFATLAPLAVKDKIIVGVAGGDSGMRGFLAAFNAESGTEAWRTYTVPAKGEPGSETWGDLTLEWGGAGTWLSGTFDPELNSIYWTTGNPWPDFYAGDRNQGDNLYSDSLVAFDADSGKMKWHFQFTRRTCGIGTRNLGRSSSTCRGKASLANWFSTPTAMASSTRSTARTANFCALPRWPKRSPGPRESTRKPAAPT